MCTRIQQVKRLKVCVVFYTIQCFSFSVYILLHPFPHFSSIHPSSRQACFELELYAESLFTPHHVIRHTGVNSQTAGFAFSYGQPLLRNPFFSSSLLWSLCITSSHTFFLSFFFFHGGLYIHPLSLFPLPPSTCLYLLSLSPSMTASSLPLFLFLPLSLLLGLRVIPLSAISLSGGKHWGRCSFDGSACGN